MSNVTTTCCLCKEVVFVASGLNNEVIKYAVANFDTYNYNVVFVKKWST